MKGIFKTKYLFPTLIVLFIIWMLFFDDNSYMYQKKNDDEINQLESTIEYYQHEINKNRVIIKDFSKQENINHYAREQYNYKKKEEYLYLVEFDTLD